jgi:general stress protein CsbA
MSTMSTGLILYSMITQQKYVAKAFTTIHAILRMKHHEFGGW